VEGAIGILPILLVEGVAAGNEGKLRVDGVGEDRPATALEEVGEVLVGAGAGVQLERLAFVDGDVGVEEVQTAPILGLEWNQDQAEKPAPHF
jgi:hypothetical protein